VFFGDVRVVADVKTVLNRLRLLSRAYFLKTHPELQARESYYQENLTQFSVPEMAAQLGITEGQVYKDLTILELSIVEAFEKNDTISRANELIRFGASVESAARTLQVGSQALRFILHHTHDSSRGTTWQRVVTFEGRHQFEEEVLAKLHMRFKSPAEIGIILNAISSADPQSIDFRTENSVSAKLVRLGLIEREPRESTEDIYFPEYGYLKQNGNLVSTSVIAFIFDHYDHDEAWLAGALEISLDRLTDFYRKHHIVRLNQKKSFKVIYSSDDNPLDRYALQRESVDKVLDWVQLHGRLPNGPDFDKSVLETGLPLRRLLFSKSFKNVAEAWMAIKMRGVERGIKIDLLDVVVRSYTAGFRDQLKQEVVERVVDWLVTHPRQRIKPALDFGRGPDKINFSMAKMIATDEYGEGKSMHHLRVFDNLEEAWLAVRARAQERGVPFRLIDIRATDKMMSSVSDEWKHILQEETLQEISDWIKLNKKIPGFKDFDRIEIPTHRLYVGRNQVTNPNAAIFPSPLELWKRILGVVGDDPLLIAKVQRQIDKEYIGGSVEEERRMAINKILGYYKAKGAYPSDSELMKDLLLDPRKFYGTGEYSIGQEAHHTPLFPNRGAVAMAVKEQAQKEGVPFLVLFNIFTLSGATVDVRQEVQREAVELVVDWISKNPGKVPFATDFLETLKFKRDWFLGTGNYAAGKFLRESRMFDSPFEAWSAVKKRAADRNISFLFMRLIARNDAYATPDFLDEVKREASELTVNWIWQHKSLPRAKKEFGHAASIPILWVKLVGGGGWYSKEGGSTIFNSPQDFWHSVLLAFDRDERWKQDTVNYLRLRDEINKKTLFRE
jgi:hypothetical protein